MKQYLTAHDIDQLSAHARAKYLQWCKRISIRLPTYNSHTDMTSYPRLSLGHLIEFVEEHYPVSVTGRLHNIFLRYGIEPGRCLLDDLWEPTKEALER